MPDAPLIRWPASHQRLETSVGPHDSETTNVVCFDAFRRRCRSLSSTGALPMQPERRLFDQEQFIFETIVRRELSGDVDF